MRILIFGGRDYGDTAAFATAMHSVKAKHPEITMVINGGAPGADKLARAWAIVEELPCLTVPAEWTKHGKRAGPLRNQKMADHCKPEAAVGFPGGPGSTDMLRRLRAAGIPVWLPYGGVNE